MAVGLLQEFDGTADQYDQVAAKVDLAGNPPDGMQAHYSMDTGGKIRIFDVWESMDKFDAFMGGPLGAAIGEIFGEGFEPTMMDVQEIHNSVTP
jgi:hypothetical protein